MEALVAMINKYDILMRHFDELAARRRLVHQQIVWGWISDDDAAERLAHVEADEARLLAVKDDRLVLFRRYGGPPRSIYHSLERSCGYANRNTFEFDLEWFARMKGLTACHHCPQGRGAA
jgi:hypothetical protein